ncbi:hypothetical protein DENSPDRAFT_752082, partial [Dentipellis sp. KUC8613]
LAKHTLVLNMLTSKEAERNWPGWNPSHQTAFDAIKALVVGCDCLTTIDHQNMGDNQVFITMDASEWHTG